MRPSRIFLATALLAAACTTTTGGDTDDNDGDQPGAEDPPAPEDDVIDEAAGEDALKVINGEMPGVAVIVEFSEGLDVDETTEALADEYQLIITSRYHALGGAAFIAPDEPVADQLLVDIRVAGVFRDRAVSLSPGDAFDAEADTDEAEAASAGEFDDVVEADGAKPGDPVSLDKLRPQVRSTGWRLIHAERVPGDGSNTRVAVIDTGVDMNHPDLEGVVADSLGKDCQRRKNKTLMDLMGHGTHVSGIIAAQNNDFGMVGVAPGTRIVPVRVLNSEGNGSWSAILCGVDYVQRHASSIDVVNMSLGGTCAYPDGTPGACSGGEPLDKALRKLVSSGVTVVVAAGNDGINADWATPAFVDELITVSAYLDWNGSITTRDRYAHFSNWGEGVDIGAPGVRIWSTLPGKKYARWNGTSMATPFVAAAAAILVQTQHLGPAGVRDELLAAARTTYPGRGGDHPERLLLIPDGRSGCGDSLCLGDETDESCPDDCGCTASACGSPAPFGCYCDEDCAATGDCCADADICPIM
jgi:subtilisin family serine protease